MSQEYTCEISPDGTHRVFNSQKAEVPVDFGSQDYADFLTWNASTYQLHYPQVKVTPGTHYFTDMSRLTKYLDRSSSMIYVSVAEPGPSLSIKTDVDVFQYKGEQPFCRLPIAHGRPVRSSTGLESHDGLWRGGGNIAVTINLFHKCQNGILGEDDPIRKYLTVPVNYCFVYLDVSDFS